jgi:hypothetical protein
MEQFGEDFEESNAEKSAVQMSFAPSEVENARQEEE